MISINTALFDIAGDKVLHDKDIIPADRDYKNVSRRVQRTKTLDGGVYISDSGYSPGDKDITVTVRSPDYEASQWFETTFSTHSQFVISTDSGVFLCAFSTLRYSGGNAILKFLVKEST